MKTGIKKRKCHNCKFGGHQFRIGKLTHLHCNHPDYDVDINNGTLSPWDTLRVFSDGCNEHQFRIKE